ncbi:phage baseplate assembly protein [Sodalis sp. C49]|uniref:phage baseplate assembly protein domain-containing protein n=1 Tax=Sodalis sp. C49 TaxID=3228929 RepID=UPI00396596DD
MDVNGRLSLLYRQIKMLLGIGRVTSMNDSGVVQQVQYQTPMEVRGKTPRLAEFGFSSGLPSGTDVILGFLGGDRSNAVIIASNHQTYRHSGLNAGETVIYNQWGLFIKLTETGIIVEARGQPVTVNHATTVTVNASDSVYLNTPVLKVSGDIIDNAGTNNTTLKNLRDTYNGHDHAMAGVEQGSATVTSKVPGEQVK